MGSLESLEEELWSGLQGNREPLKVLWGFSGGARGKEPACQCRRHKRLRFDPWVEKFPWSRKWHSTLVFLPGKFHEQRSLEFTVHETAEWKTAEQLSSLYECPIYRQQK